jgi:DNA (cytosine-5)-methyltransferase 1
MRLKIEGVELEDESERLEEKIIEVEDYQPYKLKDVYESESKKNFSFISTFAGGGGSSTGYKLSGGTVLAINEFLDHAHQTYLDNYPGVEGKILPGDIRDYTSQDFLDMAKIEPKDLDILDGSPPCTLFSMSGKREKSWNQERNYHGKKVSNIEDLTQNFLNIAEGIQPKIVVIENVKAMDAGNAKKYLARFVNRLERIGYTAKSKVLDASRYGVPQRRERVFIIGVRNDWIEERGYDSFGVRSLLFPEESKGVTTLGSAIGGLKYDVDNQKNAEEEIEKLASGNPVVVEVLKRIPHNPKKQIQFCDTLRELANERPDDPHLGKFKDNYDKEKSESVLFEFIPEEIEYDYKGREVPRLSYFNYFRTSYIKPSPTITGRCHSYYLPDGDRCFTLLELKRIMSLPDDYKMPGKKAEAEERIGLMVAPLQMKAIADHLYKTFLE